MGAVELVDEDGDVWVETAPGSDSWWCTDADPRLRDAVPWGKTDGPPRHAVEATHGPVREVPPGGAAP